MAILEALISLSCAGLSGNPHDACTKALQAGSKQSGVEQNVNHVEDHYSKLADQQARYLVGNDGMMAGAVIGGTGKAIIDKTATFKFPIFMPSMCLTTQVGVSKSMLGLEWKF